MCQAPWERGLAQMSAGCAFSSIPQVLHFSQALGGHASGQERGGLAVPRECPRLSVDGGEQGGRSPCSQR